MHIKFLRRGTGSGKRATDYLLAEKDHAGRIRKRVEILQGNPNHVAYVTDSLSFKHRYSSAVIAWAPEDKPCREEIKEVLKDFERAMGMDPNRLAITAILHEEETGGIHLHIIVARVDLETGKSYNPAPPGWKKVFDPLCAMWNCSKGWARPDDPDRARVTQPGYRALIETDQLRAGVAVSTDPKSLIGNYLMQRLEAGMIKDRKDVIAALGYAGFEINRQGKEYLSVKDRETGLKIRLKGMIYEERFTAAAAERRAEALIENRERTEEDRESDRGKSRRSREEFEQQLERITRYNEKRYRVKVQSAQEHSTQSRIAAGSDHGSDNHSRNMDLGRMDFGHLSSRSEDCASSLGADREECLTDKRASGWNDQTLSKRPGMVGSKDTGRNEVGNNHERSVRRDYYPYSSTIEGAGYDRNRRTIERIANAITESSRAIIAGTAGLAAAAKERYGAFKNTIGKLRIKMDEELENFKKLDLREYLKANGYALDLKKTTKSSTIMKKDSEKLLVGRGENGDYHYFNLSDPDDNGTIIDFILGKTGAILGDIRKALRYWKSEAVIGSPMLAFDKSKMKTALQFESLPLYTGEYLARRGIRKKTLELFDVRQNAFGSAVFLHQDLDGVCGGEVRDENLEDFTGGTKGLSIATGTESLQDVSQVVVCESMIDAMSYYQLHHDDFEKSAYVSIGGSLSDQQMEMLEKFINSTNATVKLALDNNESGKKMSKEILKKVSRKDRLEVITSKSKDWNQELKESLKVPANNQGRMLGLDFGKQ